MEISNKHHFLPQFYLKGFANCDGQFKIFNIQSKKPKKNGKLFSTGSHFYEVKANTVSFETEESDFIEKLYERSDNDLSKTILRIKNGTSQNRFDVTEAEMPLLNNFASQIYWRNPANVDSLKKYIQKYSLHQLGLKIVDSDGVHNIELSEQFKNNREFQKVYKLMTSALDSIRGFNCRTQYHILTRSSNLPFILSDNPIIFENDNNTKVYEDDYLFPLTKERIFVKRNLINTFNHESHILIDLIQIKQSHKYFAYDDISYVKFLNDLDQQNHLTLQQYKNILFESLK